MTRLLMQIAPAAPAGGPGTRPLAIGLSPKNGESRYVGPVKAVARARLLRPRYRLACKTRRARGSLG
jgi:hypothetical protein